MATTDPDTDEAIAIDNAADMHPCFSKEAARTAGRIHLPVAPRCNVQCNFCNRKYDCIAESRPGVTAKVLSPEDALARLEFVLDKRDDITVVGIAGPGDPLANLEETLRTMELVKNAHPEMILCISTNGLMLVENLDRLIEKGLSHLTITINSFRPGIVDRVYSWIDHYGERKIGGEAAELLIKKQKAALNKLDKLNIPVKINIVLIPGINDEDIPDLVDELKEHPSVTCVNIMPFIPVNGSNFEDREAPDKKQVKKLRDELEPKIPQVRHCCQCRSDAVGKISCGAAGRSKELMDDIEGFESRVAGGGFDEDSRLKVAVASSDGANVDEHFGHAKKFYIYRFNGSDLKFKELRELSPFCCSSEGTPGERLRELMTTLKDCSVVICTKIGDGPRTAMEAAGFRVVEMQNKIIEALRSLSENHQVT